MYVTFENLSVKRYFRGNESSHMCARCDFFLSSLAKNFETNIIFQNYVKVTYKLHISYSVIISRLYCNYICQIFRRKFIDIYIAKLYVNHVYNYRIKNSQASPIRYTNKSLSSHIISQEYNMLNPTCQLSDPTPTVPYIRGCLDQGCKVLVCHIEYYIGYRMGYFL